MFYPLLLGLILDAQRATEVLQDTQVVQWMQVAGDVQRQRTYPRTIGRVVSLSSHGDPADVRERLADNLKGVVAQRLLPSAAGDSRVLVAEALVVTGTARESIRKPEGHMPLKEVMERGVHPYGMQTFEMHLRQLVQQGRVAVETARLAMG